MDHTTELAEQFERSRGHLRAVALRLLGSAEEADDAVQEAWLRAAAADVGPVVNHAGWLTTIVGRVGLDMLRSRRRRAEDPADAVAVERATPAAGPEDEAILTESVGLATLVVLNRLEPAERVAFVLHDMHAVPFARIAEILGRSPAAARKLASRARGRVHGAAAAPASDLARQRVVVEAFLAASRAGDLDALLAVLTEDVVRRGGPAATQEIRGARPVAEETRANAVLARHARPALVDGRVGVVVAPCGRLLLVLAIGIDGDRVASIDVADGHVRLSRIDLAVLDGPGPPPPRRRLGEARR